MAASAGGVPEQLEQVRVAQVTHPAASSSAHEVPDNRHGARRAAGPCEVEWRRAWSSSATSPSRLGQSVLSVLHPRQFEGRCFAVRHPDPKCAHASAAPVASCARVSITHVVACLRRGGLQHSTDAGGPAVNSPWKVYHLRRRTFGDRETLARPRQPCDCRDVQGSRQRLQRRSVETSVGQTAVIIFHPPRKRILPHILTLRPYFMCHLPPSSPW